MNSIELQTSQAIKASQEGNWTEGKRINALILKENPENIGAMNRLAFCEMQLGNTSAAKKLYDGVLKRERFNSIALKYSTLLKQKVAFVPKTVSSPEDFIEEPGRTKSVALQKLADPDVLQAVPVATACVLVVKNHRVNVQLKDSKTYLGCLPDDIAFRLQKLIKLGNDYAVYVQSTSKKNCIVFIKEIVRGKDALRTPSFPAGNSHHSPSFHEDVLLDEAPLDTRETGNDETEMDIEEQPEFME